MATGTKNLLLLDAGDLLFREDYRGDSKNPSYEVQGKIFIESYNVMGWHALGIGETEFALGLDYLKSLEKLADFPFLSANIIDAGTKDLIFKPYTVESLSGIKIGITSVIGENINFSAEKQEKLGIAIENPASALKGTVRTLKRKSDFVIVLAHTGLEDAQKLADEIEGIDLIIVGHDPMRDLSKPILVGDTLITQIYSRGKYVCRLDFDIKNPERPLDFHIAGPGGVKSIEYETYRTKLKQLLVMSEELKKQKERGGDVDYQLDLIMAEIEDIKEKMADLEAAAKDENINTITPTLVPMGDTLADDPEITTLKDKRREDLIELNNDLKEEILGGGERSATDLDIEPHYVGVESCKKCHAPVYDFWLTTGHAKAYETLREKKRQFEPDCYVCHTTGFNKPGGFTNILTAKDLLGVQCETCHGPGSLHISKSVATENLIREKNCVSCHDEENDDNFQYQGDLKKITCPKKKS